MERLSKELGVEIWIKRDDCTGMSTGGNKTRKLEFLMAEALEQGADMVMTQGATQTNHGRQTTAFAPKLGLKCHILLEDRTGYQDGNYNTNGNVLLDHLHGATTQKFPAGHDMPGEMERAAEAKRAEGHKVYVIPGGGSNPTGALGYVNAAFELLGQANERGLKFDRLVPFRRGNLVFDQSIHGGRIGHPQQRLGQAHQGDALFRGEAIFGQKQFHHRGLSLCTQSLDHGAGLAGNFRARLGARGQRGQILQHLWIRGIGFGAHMCAELVHHTDSLARFTMPNKSRGSSGSARRSS
jgi:hypothetical protein